ncbi:sarcosine oxidase subunit alpha [Paralimibaculum aggregatum]|uniref:Sarcosine oxidase subunit alpha n=1 Tax=Paralimibaculum aggregatum TaxID=3036245 RepID=A0ABQ6LLH7_9RHOB|nr:2Fe-2S iron-sulfur cluster-binding protein [Limibaculum sp. NKW23]GMG84062.1 sarcosine oxidase subunit alpha [Limibaculum sp. NKW23]
MSGLRLNTGGAIDRAAQLSFTWDGKKLAGHRGDSLASALLANGERVIARGFKYHRPRGIVAAGPEEPSALVTLGKGPRRVPNAKAPEVELFDGLAASGQNAWPSVRMDVGAVNSLMSRFFAAGFYYKTFFGLTKDTAHWMQFEKVIRRAAGLGAAAREPDPDAYEVVHEHCDLLVVGSGPSGLAAAELAAAEGLDVMLVEQDFALGGGLIGAAEQVEGAWAKDWVAARLAGLKSVRVMPRTTAFGLYDGNVVGLYERVTDHLSSPDPALPRGRLRVVRPGAVILATGAIERMAAFGNNDRPGVMLAGAVERYARRFAVAPGRRTVIATGGDDGYRAALALAEAGLEAVVVDSRAAASDAVAAAADKAGIERIMGHLPLELHGKPGGYQLEIAAGGSAAGRRLPCEAVGVAGGWSPAIHLVCHRGVKPVWNEEMACFLSGEPPAGVTLTGAAAGVFGTAEAVAHARASAADAVERLTGRRPQAPEAPAPGGLGPQQPLWESKAEGRKLKSFVDLQHDVTSADIKQAAAEGYVSVEHMKRYTTHGMATDQGKTGGVLGLAILAEALGQTIPETGITTFRPPFTPVPIGAIAGRARGEHWRAVRRTPMHQVQAEAGAVFTDAGLWKRCWYMPAHDGEELGKAYVREATAVRETVGMVDVTTLGKIQVQGPDAAELLNRVYVNGFAKLPVMKCRYGVMLRDDGIVYDDGVTWRLAEDDFLMTATTAQAAGVLQWLELLLQTRWPELRVHVASTTDQWAGIAVAGPRARKALAPIVADDMGDEALPFMGILRTEVAVEGGRVPVLIARISFSGEMAYEVYTPSDFGPALWRAVEARVKAEEGCVYGVEALGALRIEKGHVTHAELDGRVTLADAGLGRMASSKKPFIGKVLAGRPELTREDRPQLAHFEPVDPAQRFRIGAIVCDPEHVEGHGLGWITGVTVAPAFGGGWLGIGMIAGGPERYADREVIIADPVRGYRVRARVFPAHRLDTKGERMHG